MYIYPLIISPTSKIGQSFESITKSNLSNPSHICYNVGKFQDRFTMKIPIFQPSTIDLAIDQDDIEENSFSSEDASYLENSFNSKDTSYLEIPNDPTNSIGWYVNSEDIATGVIDFLFKTSMDDKTQHSLGDESEENQKIYLTPNTPTPDKPCFTSLDNQNISMELHHKFVNVINEIRDLSKSSIKRKNKRRHTSRLGGQKHCVNMRWSKKKKRNSSSQKRIWSLETPVWILNNPSSKNDKNNKNTTGEANEVQPNSSISTETENLVSLTCSHCGTKKTPQWRRGPKGPGTLCNACGIRYRNGNIELKRHRSKRCEITTEPTENQD